MRFWYFVNSLGGVQVWAEEDLGLEHDEYVFGSQCFTSEADLFLFLASGSRASA